MIQADRYPAQVFWSEEDQGYIAIATDLPGCSAYGVSREEAINELLGAIDAWAQAAEAAGNPIPQPSRPADRPEYSGKMLVRMPKDLHAQLARSADTQGVSLNHYIVYVLARSQAEPPVRSYHGTGLSHTSFIPRMMKQKLLERTSSHARELAMFSVDQSISSKQSSPNLAPVLFYQTTRTGERYHG